MHIFVPIYATVPKTSNHVFGKQETLKKGHAAARQAAEDSPQNVKPCFRETRNPVSGTKVQRS